jgi:HEAT repeat protein
MQSDRRLRVALWALLVASVCFAPSAIAQYSGEAGGPGGGTSDLVNSGGTTDVVSRYNKATKGRNLTEWVKNLGDEDPVRRLDAVKSLGDSNDPKAIDYLIQAVNDPDPRVETKAVDYLGKLHAADSTLFLIQKLVTVGTRDRLRHRIVMTLGKIGDPRASRPLLQYVMQDGNPDIRGAGIFALGEIGDQSIREDLQRFSDYEDDPRLKRLAGEALTKIATRQLAPPPRKPSTFPTALDAALATDQH